MITGRIEKHTEKERAEQKWKEKGGQQNLQWRQVGGRRRGVSCGN